MQNKYNTVLNKNKIKSIKLIDFIFLISNHFKPTSASVTLKAR